MALRAFKCHGRENLDHLTVEMAKSKRDLAVVVADRAEFIDPGFSVLDPLKHAHQLAAQWLAPRFAKYSVFVGSRPRTCDPS